MAVLVMDVSASYFISRKYGGFMKLLVDAIKEKGMILDGNILKVDAIINHQIDAGMMNEIGNAFYNHFKDKGITKVVTVESSGIAPALMCAVKLDVPLVFLKKVQPSTMRNPIVSEVFSYTKNKHYVLCAEKDYFHADDQLLFIDDFLANGEAFKGVEQIVSQTEAQISGVGIVIEKSFQQGHDYIVNKGYDFLSLANIVSFEKNQIQFGNDE